MFRAWDRQKKIWLDPSMFAISGSGSLIAFDQYPDDKNSPQKEWGKLYISEKILVNQYTGVKDDKGKKIYEGDIIKWADYDDGWGHDDDPIERGIGKVTWGHNAHGCDYSYGFFISCADFTSRGLELKEMEVVGNIYENRFPSLTKRTDDK